MRKPCKNVEALRISNSTDGFVLYPRAYKNIVLTSLNTFGRNKQILAMVDGLMVHQEVETLEAIANAIGIGYEGNNQ